jgi:hypothetical protein
MKLTRSADGDAFRGPSGYHLDRLGRLIFSG